MMKAVCVGHIARNKDSVEDIVEINSFGGFPIAIELSTHIATRLLVADYVVIMSKGCSVSEDIMRKLKVIASRHSQKFASIYDDHEFVGIVKVGFNDATNDERCCGLLDFYLQL